MFSEEMRGKIFRHQTGQWKRDEGSDSHAAAAAAAAFCISFLWTFRISLSL
jgi:hypothetical protein